MDITIRTATINDSNALTDISFAAKQYWNYPEEYYKVWQSELTITPDYIRNNILYVAEKAGRIIGYFSLIEVNNDFWAGKVFVKSGGKRVGSKLIAILKMKCREMKINTGFYEKLGACYRGESPSSIEGRSVSLYELYITCLSC